MSSEENKGDKTEEPTEGRLQKAIEEGNVPSSREVAAFMSLAATMAICSMLSYGSAEPILRLMTGFISRPEGWAIKSYGDAEAILSLVALEMGLFLLPALTLLAVVGVASSAIQNVPRVVANRITPKWSRVSVQEGLKRIFGSQGWFEFGKAIVKLLFVSAIAAMYLYYVRDDIFNVMRESVSVLPDRIASLVAGLLAIFVGSTLILAVADYGWSRYSWRRNLRMSHQEVKDEMKQTHGDPIIKSRLRSLSRHRARSRMMAKVPNATMVIANPTHYAVALRYVRAEGGVPMVLAKGKDLIALRIRETAEENGIPIIEDKPLARSLYDKVTVDMAIPQEFYKALAKVILFLQATGQVKQG